MDYINANESSEGLGQDLRYIATRIIITHPKYRYCSIAIFCSYFFLSFFMPFWNSEKCEMSNYCSTNSIRTSSSVRRRQKKVCTRFSAYQDNVNSFCFEIQKIYIYIKVEEITNITKIYQQPI